ncbi:MAG: hypothetical protein Q9M31_04860 [Mariprofundus sp.]|nr:hypothetical protein [Mariprofundus sp.]
MLRVHPSDSAILADHGLNLQAVFDLVTLPAHIVAQLEAVEATKAYRQLLVFGHGGRRFWQALSATKSMDADNPVDRFSINTINSFFSEENPENSYRVIFPEHHGIVPLQQLGKLAGWHHDSPFLLGLNSVWGSWFAYRAVVLADTAFALTQPLPAISPCEVCVSRACLSACPAVIFPCSEITLAACIKERLQESSCCAHRCLARMACPVMAEQRYGDQQMAYHYGCSLETIRHHRGMS